MSIALTSQCPLAEGISPYSNLLSSQRHNRAVQPRAVRTLIGLKKRLCTGWLTGHDEPLPHVLTFLVQVPVYGSAGYHFDFHSYAIIPITICGSLHPI
jgi:hypothetical protein